MIRARLGRPFERGYLAILSGDLALCLLLTLTEETGGPLAAIAVGGFVFLVLVPETLRAIGQRALARERVSFAERLAAVRELLQPLAGVGREHAVLRALSLVRAGDLQPALAELRRAVAGDAGDPDAELTVHEQMVQLLLFERRFVDAIGHCERTLGAGYLESRPALMSLLVRAYAEEGRMREAANLLGRIEASPFSRDLRALPLLNQARLAFLAFAGRAAVVEELCTPGASVLFGDGAAESGAFFVGVAWARAGQKERALAALERSARLARRRPRIRLAARELIERISQPAPAWPLAAPAAEGAEAAGGMDADGGNAGAVDADVAAVADAVASRARALHALPRAAVGVRALPVTFGILAVNLAVYAVTSARGPLTDPLHLLRVGASFPPAVAAGQLWRLWTAMFLHAGPLHLFGNLYILWWIGRIAEPLFGRRRFLLLYLAAGLGGGIGSVAWRLGKEAAPTVGASGAVLGLVGAVVAVLIVHGPAWPARLRSWLLLNLVLLAGLELFLGARLPEIDNACHAGGMISGALLALLLAPRQPFGKRMGRKEGPLARGLLWAALSAAAAAVLFGFVMAAVTPAARTVLRAPWKTAPIAGVRVEIPATWRAEPLPGGAVRFVDPLLRPLLSPVEPTGTLLVAPQPGPPAPGALAALVQRDLAALPKQDDVGSAIEVPPPAWLIAPGAEARAERIQLRTEEASVSLVRVLELLPSAGGGHALLELALPERDLASYRPVLARILAGVRASG